jgi:hypothetical protein
MTMVKTMTMAVKEEAITTILMQQQNTTRASNSCLPHLKSPSTRSTASSAFGRRRGAACARRRTQASPPRCACRCHRPRISNMSNCCELHPPPLAPPLLRPPPLPPPLSLRLCETPRHSKRYLLPSASHSKSHDGSLSISAALHLHQRLPLRTRLQHTAHLRELLGRCAGFHREHSRTRRKVQLLRCGGQHPVRLGWGVSVVISRVRR